MRRIGIGGGLLIALASGALATASVAKPQSMRPVEVTSSRQPQRAGALVRLRARNVPAGIGKFGLLAPGVGWAANGVGFYMTYDNGRNWSELRVPGLGGDVIANLLTAASPIRGELVVASVDGGSVYGTCADPGPRGSSNRPVGEVAVTSDAGQSWSATPLPGCEVPRALSFFDRTDGFVLASGATAHTRAVLFKTTDEARSWQLVGRPPVSGPIDFTSPENGFLLGPTRAQSDQTGALYHTSDGGHSWQRVPICIGSGGIGLRCGMPQFFGRNGVMPAVAEDLTTQTDHPFTFVTYDNGLDWYAHTPPDDGTPTTRTFPTLSAASRRDLFLLSVSGTLFTTTNGGYAWTAVAARRFRDAQEMTFINASDGWILAGRRFDYTTDGGQTWRPIGSR